MKSFHRNWLRKELVEEHSADFADKFGRDGKVEVVDVALVAKNSQNVEVGLLQHHLNWGVLQQ